MLQLPVYIGNRYNCCSHGPHKTQQRFILQIECISDPWYHILFHSNMDFTIAIFLHFRCHCNQCPLMETAQQCKCCHEMLRMMAKLDRLRDEAPGQEIPVCITQHPGFQAVCLNRYVLQTAYSVYKVRHGHKPGSLPEYVYKSNFYYISNISDIQCTI